MATRKSIIIETKEKEPSLFKKHTLDALADHVGLRLDYISHLFTADNLFQGMESVCRRIEHEPLELYSIIAEAKKDREKVSGSQRTYNYHIYLTRLYILLYYLHHDDEGIYKTFVFPELIHNMGFYSEGNYLQKRINREIDIIVNQEKTIEEAMKKQEQRAEKGKSSVRIQDRDGSWVSAEEFMKKHFTATDIRLPDMKSLLGITTPVPQTADAPSEQARIDELEADNARLKSELKTLQAQSGKTGLTASQAALLMLTVCHNMGNLPNDKKKLSPVLESLWGFTEATAKRALGAKPTAEVAEKTALLFDTVSPKLARKIREFPSDFDNIRKLKLQENNDSKKVKKT